MWQHTSAGGVLFPVVYHRRDPVRWSAPVDRVASRSAHIVVGAGHGRLSSTWLKYLGPGPGEGASLKGGTCAPVPAQPQGRQGRTDRKGGHLPHGSEAQGGMSRAHRPSRGERRQSWTPGHGPHLCGPPGSAPLDAVRLLQGRAGRSRPLSRPICTTPNQEAAWQALTDFSESEMSGQVPPDGGDLGAGLGAVHALPGLPSDEAVIKLAICDTCGQTSSRTRQGQRTASIQAQGQGQARRRTDHHQPDTRPWPSPATAYPDRINPYL